MWELVVLSLQRLLSGAVLLSEVPLRARAGTVTGTSMTFTGFNIPKLVKTHFWVIWPRKSLLKQPVLSTYKPIH